MSSTCERVSASVYAPDIEEYGIVPTTTENEELPLVILGFSPKKIRLNVKSDPYFYERVDINTDGSITTYYIAPYPSKRITKESHPALYSNLMKLFE
jgi:hypothetical protein